MYTKKILQIKVEFTNAPNVKLMACFCLVVSNGAAYFEGLLQVEVKITKEIHQGNHTRKCENSDCA